MMTRGTSSMVAVLMCLAASGCALSPLDDIHPSSGTRPSGVDTMDGSADPSPRDAGAQASDSGRARDSGASRDAGDAASADRDAGGNGNAGRGGSTLTGGAAGAEPASAGATSTAGASGSAGAAPISMEAATKMLEDETRRYFTRISDRVQISCECETTTADKARCAWSKPRNPHVDCMFNAFQRVPSSVDFVRCSSDVELDWRACYEKSNCAPEAFDACDDENLAMRQACAVPDEVLVNRCLDIYRYSVGSEAYMGKAAQFMGELCRCAATNAGSDAGAMPDGNACLDEWYSGSSAKATDCVVASVYALEARNLTAANSPAIAALECMNEAFQGYVTCMREKAASCDQAASDQCTTDFTNEVADECGADGIPLFSCILGQ